MPKLEIVDVDYEVIKHETDKAWLFVINTKDVWIPKSVGELDTDAKSVAVPTWFAVEHELV